ncbi:histidine phosphatase family protein [Oleiharenicola lentus]|uniref:histidine phosphatase family protein n=1 Tax=Oleiharenicola lentus TaxID=2508720 RepID=UPI003F66FE96
MELYYVRHGETAWSLTGQHTGKTDLPLTPHGEVEARTLHGLLEGVTFDQVFTSPRQRARRTAELAGFDHAVTEPDLAEWDYGDYDGLRMSEIRAQRPTWDIYVDGCPGGESPEQIVARADRLVARWSKSSGRIAAFSHGHFGRVLAARWIGLPLSAAKHFAVNTASYGILDRDPSRDGRARIVQWNITAKRP